MPQDLRRAHSFYREALLRYDLRLVIGHRGGSSSAQATTHADLGNTLQRLEKMSCVETADLIATGTPPACEP